MAPARVKEREALISDKRGGAVMRPPRLTLSNVMKISLIIYFILSSSVALAQSSYPATVLKERPNLIIHDGVHLVGEWVFSTNNIQVSESDPAYISMQLDIARLKAMGQLAEYTYRSHLEPVLSAAGITSDHVRDLILNRLSSNAPKNEYKGIVTVDLKNDNGHIRSIIAINKNALPTFETHSVSDEMEKRAIASSSIIDTLLYLEFIENTSSNEVWVSNFNSLFSLFGTGIVKTLRHGTLSRLEPGWTKRQELLPGTEIATLTIDELVQLGSIRAYDFLLLNILCERLEQDGYMRTALHIRSTINERDDTLYSGITALALLELASFRELSNTTDETIEAIIMNQGGIPINLATIEVDYSMVDELINCYSPSRRSEATFLLAMLFSKHQDIATMCSLTSSLNDVGYPAIAFFTSRQALNSTTCSRKQSAEMKWQAIRSLYTLKMLGEAKIFRSSMNMPAPKNSTQRKWMDWLAEL